MNGGSSRDSGHRETGRQEGDGGAMKLLCQVLVLVPLAYLVLCAGVFIVCGTNMLPGYEGLRWFALMVMALLGAGAFAAIVEEWR